MDPERFGAFIQAQRKELGMTQADLAQKLNVTDKAISRWERGVGFPDIRLLEPLANALDLTLVELMQSRTIETTLSKEEADTLLTETVEIIEVQKKLSWQRKIILFLSHAAMILAAWILIYASRNAQWEPKWLGAAVYGIAIIGVFFGSRALQYIVKKMYLHKKPWGIWHSYHTWVVFGLAVIGIQLMTNAWKLQTGDSIWGILVFIIGFVLILSALIYYAYHEHDIKA